MTDGPRLAMAGLVAARVAAETATFQRDVAWARLAERQGSSEQSGAPAWTPPVERIETGTFPEAHFENPVVPGALRIALVATPRTGNTWVRTLLAEAFDLDQVAVHAPTGIPWTDLPARLVVQLHWHRLPCFRNALVRSGFRIVTIARNPIDVLVSVLQFRQSEPTTEFWLSGEGGNEDSLVGAEPGSGAFRAWAVSDRARALLSVSVEWSSDQESIRVRYEDFVLNPGASLLALTRQLDADPVRDPRTLGEQLSLEEMRRRFTATPGHFWKGQPGLGLAVLDSGAAREIVEAHESVFRSLSYSHSVPPRTVEQAVAAWTRLAAG